MSSAVILPAIWDTVNGPRFAVPGATSLELEEGTWELFELTATTTGGGG